jgi:hypothetical protein
MIHSDEPLTVLDSCDIELLLEKEGIVVKGLKFGPGNPYNIYPNYMSGESKCCVVTYIGDDLDRLDTKEKLMSKVFKDRFDGDRLCPVYAATYLCATGKIPKGYYFIVIQW